MTERDQIDAWVLSKIRDDKVTNARWEVLHALKRLLRLEAVLRAKTDLPDALEEEVELAFQSARVEHWKATGDDVEPTSVPQPSPVPVPTPQFVKNQTVYLQGHGGRLFTVSDVQWTYNPLPDGTVMYNLRDEYLGAPHPNWVPERLVSDTPETTR